MPREAGRRSPSAISRRTWDWPIRSSSSPFRGAPRSSPVARPPETFLSRLRPMVAVFLIAAGGCASNGPMRAGEKAERRSDYDRAVLEYTNALRANPDNRTARMHLERVRVRAAQEHFLRGRRLAASGRHEEAAIELQLAVELNPTDTAADAALREVRQ